MNCGGVQLRPRALAGGALADTHQELLLQQRMKQLHLGVLRQHLAEVAGELAVNLRQFRDLLQQLPAAIFSYPAAIFSYCASIMFTSARRTSAASRTGLWSAGACVSQAPVLRREHDLRKEGKG